MTMCPACNWPLSNCSCASDIPGAAQEGFKAVEIECSEWLGELKAAYRRAIDEWYATKPGTIEDDNAFHAMNRARERLSAARLSSPNDQAQPRGMARPNFEGKA